MSCPSCLPTNNDLRIARGAEFSIFRGSRLAQGNDFPQNRSCENGNLAHARIQSPTCEGVDPTSYPQRAGSKAPSPDQRAGRPPGGVAARGVDAGGSLPCCLEVQKGSTIF